jgi:2-oxoglutarate ferredoxin oxidoreductase subunit delta
MAKTGEKAAKTRTFRVQINTELCKGCNLCVMHCPKDCLELTTDRINSRGTLFSECLRPEDCIGCKACATICPDGVIELFEIVDEDEENDG